MPISKKRIIKIIQEGICGFNLDRDGQRLFEILTQIILENEGIDRKTWNEVYTNKKRQKIIESTETLILEALLD